MDLVVVICANLVRWGTKQPRVFNDRLQVIYFAPFLFKQFDMFYFCFLRQLLGRYPVCL